MVVRAANGSREEQAFVLKDIQHVMTALQVSPMIVDPHLPRASQRFGASLRSLCEDGRDDMASSVAQGVSAPCWQESFVKLYLDNGPREQALKYSTEQLSWDVGRTSPLHIDIK